MGQSGFATCPISLSTHFFSFFFFFSFLNRGLLELAMWRAQKTPLLSFPAGFPLSLSLSLSLSSFSFFFFQSHRPFPVRRCVGAGAEHMLHQPPQTPLKPSPPVARAITHQSCRGWTHVSSRFNDQILLSIHFLWSLPVFLEPLFQELSFYTHIAW